MTSTDNQSKRGISLRLDHADIDRIKAIARRLKVRESDIYRLAVRRLLIDLAPLADPYVKGRDLLPVFTEHGAELVTQFNLNTARLEQIFNEDLEVGENAVASGDIALIAMAAMPEHYIEPRLRRLGLDGPIVDAAESLKRYLETKYTKNTLSRP